MSSPPFPHRPLRADLPSRRPFTPKWTIAPSTPSSCREGAQNPLGAPVKLCRSHIAGGPRGLKKPVHAPQGKLPLCTAAGGEGGPWASG